jgi:hypothetical protein
MTDARPAVPARPPRDVRVDIIRGWLQLTIFASHAAGSWIGAWLIHGAWGLSDSSEQFVFLSGFMLGSVFARKALRQGWGAASRDMMLRTVRLYRTHMITFALFGAMAILAGLTGLWGMEAQRLGWGFMLRDPLRAVPAALTTLYQPNYMDILPVFIWCMLVLPLFAWLEARIGDWALLAPIALYAATWMFGLVPPSLGPDTAIGFNPLAWQILFLFGAWLGRRSLLLGEALPNWRLLTVGAIAVVLAGLALRLAWFGFLPWHAPVGETEAIIGKDALALPRVVPALALAWLLACLLPREAPWMHGAAGRWLAAAGRNSLQVFCFGLFLSWGVTAAFRLWPRAWWLDPLLLTSGFALLLLFSQFLERQRDVAPVAVPVRP